MKQGQNARKARGRPQNRKPGNNRGNQASGPKVRGNPKQQIEKYNNAARDALQEGDRVKAEYYYQFADHYQRILNEAKGPPKEQGGGRPRRGDQNQNGDGGKPGGSQQGGDQGDGGDQGPSMDHSHDPRRENAERDPRADGEDGQSEAGGDAGGKDKPKPARRGRKPATRKRDGDGDTTASKSEADNAA